MNKEFFSAAVMENAVKIVLHELKKRSSTANYVDMTEERLWHELVSCLLGSGVLFETAQSACEVLKNADLLQVPEKQSAYMPWQDAIRKTLDSPLFEPLKKDGNGRRYRYPNVKAKQICSTAGRIYGSGSSLKKILCGSNSEEETRFCVARQSDGVGIKQASLFLRNIGFAMNLAILDTHVLKYMLHFRMITQKHIQDFNAKMYAGVENVLRNYAERLESHLAHVDTAIWIVMRVARRKETNEFSYLGVGRN